MRSRPPRACRRSRSPAVTAPLDAQYFRRIAAIEFAVKHDDGRGADDLHNADIVLVGVSRTSKTPTSMHLGYMGYMAANIPLVRGVDPPPALFAPRPLEGGRPHDRRRPADRDPSGAGCARSRPESGARVCRHPKRSTRSSRRRPKLHERLGCPVIDVAGLAIEECAARCAELVEERRRAAIEAGVTG